MPTLSDLVRQRLSASFVNRETEVSAFLRLLDEDHCPYRILGINGVGGVGKSSLLERFGSLCRERDVPLVAVDCAIHKSSYDFMLQFRRQINSELLSHQFIKEFDRIVDKISQLSSNLLGGKETQSPEAANVAIRSSVSALKSFIPFVAPVLDGIEAEKKLQGYLDNYIANNLSRADRELILNAEKTLTDMIIDAINRFLKKKLRFVAIIDTFEQAGGLGMWLREKLIPGLPDGSVVVIAGRESLTSEWQPFLPLLRQITLVNFSNSDAESYLRTRGIVSEKTVEDIFHFTQGHPLSIAISADIKANTTVSADEGLKPSEKFVVIRSLLDRIFSQIIQPELRQLLEACAIVRRFNEDVLAALEPDLEIRSLFNQLRDFSFVSYRGDSFALHESAREYLLQEMHLRSPDRFRLLNARALNYFNKLALTVKGDDIQNTTIESLYHQLILDEDLGIEIFRGLFEASAFTFSILYCERLNDLIASSSLANSTNLNWARYYQGALAFRKGKWNEQEQICLGILRESRLPLELRARAAMDLANVYMRRGKLEMAEGMIKQSLDDTKQCNNDRLTADALFELGKIYRWLNRWEDSLSAFQQARDLFQLANRSSRYAEAIMHIGAVNQLRGHWTEAVQNLSESVRLFTLSENRYGLSRALINHAWVLVMTGNWQAAEELARRSLEVAEELGVEHSIGSILIVLADVCRSTARLDEAQVCLERSQAILSRLSYDVYLGYLYRSLGQLRIAQNHPADGLSLFSRSEDVFRGLGASAELALTLAHKGYLQINLGQEVDASSSFNNVLALLTKFENRYAEAKALIGLCQLERHEKDHAHRDGYCRLAHQISTTYGYKDLAAEVAMLQIAEHIKSHDWKPAADQIANVIVMALLFNRRLVRKLSPTIYTQFRSCVALARENSVVVSRMHSYIEEAPDMSDANKAMAKRIVDEIAFQAAMNVSSFHFSLGPWLG
jgi:tetratricopeptide (TPR) repeat protein